MPEISRFFGIIITMYVDDHNPPHFHARYNNENALIAIESAEVLAGALSTKILRLVQAWTEIHREELLKNWEESQKENPQFKKIDPLQ